MGHGCDAREEDAQTRQGFIFSRSKGGQKQEEEEEEKENVFFCRSLHDAIFRRKRDSFLFFLPSFFLLPDSFVLSPSVCCQVCTTLSPSLLSSLSIEVAKKGTSDKLSVGATILFPLRDFHNLFRAVISLLKKISAIANFRGGCCCSPSHFCIKTFLRLRCSTTQSAGFAHFLNTPYFYSFISAKLSNSSPARPNFNP